MKDELLKKLKRMKTTMTHEQIARLIGTSERQIYRWLKEENRISKPWRMIIGQRLKEIND